MRSAMARGRTRRGAALLHGVRNASIPLVTVFGLEFGSTLAIWAAHIKDIDNKVLSADTADRGRRLVGAARAASAAGGDAVRHTGDPAPGAQPDRPGQRGEQQELGGEPGQRSPVRTRRGRDGTDGHRSSWA